jgi:serine/threonine protein kinase
MPPDPAEEFLGLFRRSELFDPAGLARHFPPGSALPPDPSDCAAALVRAGLLTAYQAKQLLLGKYKGFVLGSYKILQPVGKGGSGTVFLAEHTAMRRKVALKVVQLDKAQDKLSLERFRREARSAAALSHPNIVRLFDVGQHGRTHYMAMEFVDGRTLDGLVSESDPVPFAQAVAYAAQAAAGLRHAHEKGLVHRDVKPSNLILASDGTVKLLDMGLARSFEDEADNLTAALGGEADGVGTADYVSPEQALNQEVDARGDVYSLGATLYALVAGAPPFRGTMLQKLAQHQTVEPTPLSSLRPDVPEALDLVVSRMMAKKPSGRYASAGAVIEALSPWLLGGQRSRPGATARPEPPAPKSSSRRPGRHVEAEAASAVILDELRPRRARKAAALIAGSVLFSGLCLGGVALLFFRSPPPPAESAAPPPPSRPPAASPPAPSPTPAAPERPVDPRFTLFPIEKFGTATTRLPLFDDNGAGEAALPGTPLQWVGEVPFRVAPANGPQARNVLQLRGTLGGAGQGRPRLGGPPDRRPGRGLPLPRRGGRRGVAVAGGRRTRPEGQGRHEAQNPLRRRRRGVARLAERRGGRGVGAAR